VTREVVISKHLVAELRTYSDMVRREDARITRSADVQLDPIATAPHATASPTSTTSAGDNVPSIPAEHASQPGPDAVEQTIQLREEELRARTQVVQVGAVEVRTGVVAEQQSIVVRLEHEETDVELLPVEHRSAARAVGSGEDVVDIPEYGEQVSVRKRPVVVEEITVGKATVEEVKQVTTTLRREEAHVEMRGDIRLS
jgi:uncharacterized protein (TIGR02271 family)